MKLIAGSSHTFLASSIAQQLNIQLIDREISHFSNGEKRVWIKEDLKNQQVAVLQSFSHNVDEMIVETLLLIDALQRLSVNNITLIIPWMGYSLQNKAFRKGEPNSAQIIANLISNTRIQRVVLLDLHNSEILTFFDIPTIHLSAQNLLTNHLKNSVDLSHAVVVAPDHGGIPRAQVVAKNLNLEMASINKERDLATGQIQITDHQGDVKNKDIILVDDVIVSGSTAIKAAEHLKQNQANQIYFLATHALLTDDAVSKIESSAINQTIVTNSIQHNQLSNKFTVLDLGPFFAQELKTL